MPSSVVSRICGTLPPISSSPHRQCCAQQECALLELAIACGERYHLRLADHRHCLEVEAGGCFADGQSCFGQVTLNAAATANRALQFSQLIRDSNVEFAL